MRWSEPSSVSGLPDELRRVKSWCRIHKGDAIDDADLLDMIQAAMRYVEAHQRRQLLTATYALYLDDWPDNGIIEIRDKLPIRSITSVQYKDEDGDTQTVTSSNYHTSFASWHSPARIKPISGYTWPTLETGSLERVTVNLTAGYGSADNIPMTTRAAIRYLVSHMVENREPVVVGTGTASLPLTVKAAMDADCWGFYA